MDEDSFDIESLPSSISLESTYTPNSEMESPIDSPFAETEKETMGDILDENVGDVKDMIDDKIVDGKYMWVPLGENWRKILMSNLYVVKDCLPDGNCQFRSLEEALKSDTHFKLSHKKLRNKVADYILTLSDVQFQEILNNYKIEKESGEFYGDWDPNTIKTKRQLALEIKKPGFNFEGDNMTLSILSKVLGIDIFIFNENTHTITKIENNNTSFVILNFIQQDNAGHYKTIGFKPQNSVQTIFDRADLHDDLKSLIDKNIFYKRHIERIYDLYEPFTCNDLISNMEILLGKLTVSDKNLICSLSSKIVTRKTPKPRKRVRSKAKSAVRSKAKKSKSVKKSKRKSVKKSKRKSVKKSKSKRKSVKKSKSKSVKKSKRKSKRKE